MNMLKSTISLDVTILCPNIEMTEGTLTSNRLETVTDWAGTVWVERKVKKFSGEICIKTDPYRHLIYKSITNPHKQVNLLTSTCW